MRSTEGAFLAVHPRSRFTVALLLSLLVHALLLSLQFGIRGLGLPGFQSPWGERRVIAPALTVRITGANKATSSSIPANTGLIHSPAMEKPRVQEPSVIAVAPRMKMTLAQRTEETSSRLLPREVRKPAPASVKQVQTTVVPPRPHHRKPSPAKPRRRIIATRQVTPDAFTVPTAQTDEARMREWAAEVAEREAPPTAATQPDDEALAMKREEERLEQIRKLEEQKQEQKNARRQVLEQEALEQEVRRQETRRQAEQLAQQQAAQELEEQNRRREQQLEASRLAEEAARQQALEQEARRQAEQIAQQQAAQQLEEQNLLRAQQIEASRREEENAQRQALALEAQRQAEQQAQQQAARQREEERARQQAQELEARRQAEQIARQQAAQQQYEENARRQAEELEARRQAEQIAEQEAARRQEEESAQRARQLEAQRLADENAQREAAELEARRQGEEAAARQAAALEGQRQAGELAAAGNAQGQTFAQDADAAGTPGLVHVPGSESTASGSSGASGASGTSDTEPHDDTTAATDDGPFLLSDSDLASVKVMQVRKVDATRLDARAAQELASAQDSRRRTIFGSADDDIVLKMYIDSWRQAIERNGDADHGEPQVRGDADVTVVIRSDGNIESITVNHSDEQHALDDAVRRIAASSGQRNAFPPDLMRRYDVIEIRRVWRFDDRLTILEGR